MVCEYLDWATVRQIADDPNHLGFQQDNLSSTLETLGNLVKPGIGEDSRASCLVEQIHGQEKSKRHSRQDIYGQNNGGDLAAGGHHGEISGRGRSGSRRVQWGQGPDLLDPEFQCGSKLVVLPSTMEVYQLRRLQRIR